MTPVLHFFRSIFRQHDRVVPGGDVRTTFLFVEPSGLAGAGRVFDFWGNFDMYTISRDAIEADMRAIYADWRVVGQDIRDVVARESRHIAC